MRRGLLSKLPAMSQFYPGFLPHHLDDMTMREISEYVTQMERAED